MEITPVGKIVSVILQKCDLMENGIKATGRCWSCNGVGDFLFWHTLGPSRRIFEWYGMGRYSMVALEMLRPIQGRVSIASCTHTW